MTESPHDLARRLADRAEAVCRHYLSNGYGWGRYWVVGDVRNTPGRSMFVRLADAASGPAGKWTDAATGEHGDLLDVIRESRGFTSFRDIAAEARAFLGMLPAETTRAARPVTPVPSGSPQAARRLFAMSRPIAGTIAETYLRYRGLVALHGIGALRFHPRCYYRSDDGSPVETWPALIAAVTGLGGRITGVHRTWLDLSGHCKAPIDTPRRAMGLLLGHGVRFGVANDVMAAGEGIETMLSPRSVVPTLPMMAALSANHLAAILFPAQLRRLYIACDNDPAGDAAAATLTQRAVSAGIEVMPLSPTLADWNEDLRRLGIEAVRAALRVQLAPQDVARFMEPMAGAGTEG